MRKKVTDFLPERLEKLIGEDIKADPLLFARHKSFIASHLFGGLCALGLLPLYIFQSSSPSLLGFMVIAWLFAPALISIYVAKTGKIIRGYFLSSLSLGGLVGFLAALTGGISSFLLPWLIVVPVEAALSGSRRVVISAIGVTCISLFCLALASHYQLLPKSLVVSQNLTFLLAVGLVSAVSYVGGLAMSIQNMHQRSERELEERERRFRLLAENATDMITRHDRNGQVRFASGAVKELLGVKADEIMEEGLFARVHVADRPAYLRAFVQALELSTPASAQFRLKGEGGRYSWVEMYARPVKGVDEEGEAESLVAITRDISSHKDLTDDLREAKKEAEDANESKSRFLANMSHELRTPLNAIIGFSEVMKKGLSQTESQREEYAGIIHKSGTHLLSVVNDLLEMSKLENGSVSIHKESFPLSDIILEVIALMSGEAEKAGVQIKAPMNKRKTEIYADRRAIKQILINLLSNSIKFSPDGGKIEILTENGDEEFSLCVKDTGKGIPEDILPQLGRPFVQAQTDYNRSHEGTGLGLSIVKGLAELHGGHMEIESKLDKGTLVTIRLPNASALEGHGKMKMDQKKSA